MAKHYEDDRLYCLTCNPQPTSFREEIKSQVNEVDPDGTLFATYERDVAYECFRCGRRASWGYELNSATSQP